MKYRKKPLIVDAIQWDGQNQTDVIMFLEGIDARHIPDHGEHFELIKDRNDESFMFKTSFGRYVANIGDWFIRDSKGLRTPCTAGTFESTYELIDPKNNSDYETLYENTAEELAKLETLFKCNFLTEIQEMLKRYSILESDIKNLPENSRVRFQMEGELEATLFWIIKFNDLFKHCFPNKAMSYEPEFMANYRKNMRDWPNNGLEFSFPDKYPPSENNV